MDKRNGIEYVQNPSECPFCGSDNIDGGVDNSFEGDSMISGGCVCRACRARWAESYTLDGWIEHVEDGPDVYHQDIRWTALEDAATSVLQRAQANDSNGLLVALDEMEKALQALRR